MSYRIIKADSSVELENKVNYHIKQGYVPVGNVSSITWYKG